MKIIKKLLLGGLFAAALTSCVSTNKGFQSSPVISRNVELDKIKADIKVDEKKKLKGSSESVYFLFWRVSGDNTLADGINYSTDAGSASAGQIGNFTIPNPYKAFKVGKLNKVRAAAAYKALETGDYDFMLHPNYSMTTQNFLGIIKIYTCEVTGYGANYTNFRTEREKKVILQDGKEIILQDR